MLRRACCNGGGSRGDGRVEWQGGHAVGRLPREDSVRARASIAGQSTPSESEMHAPLPCQSLSAARTRRTFFMHRISFLNAPINASVRWLELDWLFDAETMRDAIRLRTCKDINLVRVEALDAS